MKKRKLELKDIVSYLPYGMLFQEQRDHAVLRMDSIESRNCHEIWAIQKYLRGLGKDVNDINYPYLSAKNCSGQGFRLGDIKPIIHPVSDMTKSIKVEGYNNGKEFIPMVELAKKSNVVVFEYSLEIIKSVPNCIKIGDGYILQYLGDSFMCLDKDNAEYSSIDNVHLFDLLNQWLFDYRELIDDGLAIDINTINK